MADQTSKTGFATRAIHGLEHARQPEGALNPPLYLSSTFTFDRVEEGAAMFAGERPGHFYSRVSNPTLSALEERFAALEEAESSLCFASGMGAITSVFWTFLSAGDEVIADKTLYGCTFAFLHHGLSRFGVKVIHVDMTDPAAVAAVLSEKTKIVYFESPANPNMRLVDIAAISTIARNVGAKTIVDNTYCTPYLQQPLKLGADIAVHSATKYLGGHGDLIAGMAAGSADDMMQVRVEGLKDMTGAVMTPLTAHQIMRGLKTLDLRMDRHCASAQEIAERLEAHPLVKSVSYPGLKSFAQFALAKRQMRAPGGMIALELNTDIGGAMHMMNALTLIKRAVSLGDADSLIQHPASMTHAAYSKEERAEHGISDSLIRLSVGLESARDIWADLESALGTLKATSTAPKAA
ncbi:MAG: methionine gamma-lyase [Robiginitomaculum sp.]|nr:MAG: methionine gamma-lyase [Robiginitomaculum sp.]